MASYTYLLNNQMKGLKGKKNPQPKSIAGLYPAGEAKCKTYNPCRTDSKTAWGCDALCSKMDFSVVDAKTLEATSYLKVAHAAQKTIMTEELKKELNTKMDADKKKRKKNRSRKRSKSRLEEKKAMGSGGRHRYILLRVRRSDISVFIQHRSMIQPRILTMYNIQSMYLFVSFSMVSNANRTRAAVNHWAANIIKMPRLVNRQGVYKLCIFDCL